MSRTARRQSEVFAMLCRILVRRMANCFCLYVRQLSVGCFQPQQIVYRWSNQWIPAVICFFRRLGLSSSRLGWEYLIPPWSGFESVGSHFPNKAARSVHWS